MFAYVPKVACTNWKCLMRKLAGHDDWLDPSKAHVKEQAGLNYFDPQDGSHQILQRPGVTTYTMVRHPGSGALSAFLDKIHRYKDLTPDEVAGLGQTFASLTAEIDSFRRLNLSQDAYPQVNFEVFLLWLRDSGHRMVANEHWLPQVNLLRHNRIQFDLVGRFENIAQDAPKILDAMDARTTFPTQSQVKFRPTRAQANYDLHTNRRCEKLLRDLFKSDFEAYGYD